MNAIDEQLEKEFPTCTECEGTGKIWSGEDCPVCLGDGYTKFNPRA